MEDIAIAVPPETPARPPREPRGLLHEAFQAQARRTPEALAVLTAEGERLTYAELDRLSDRLARFLVRQGMRPEVPVGVCLERSPELVIALLAVLKAGGVYLPLDPAYPADRLAYMLEDSGAPLVLTRTRWMPVLFGGVALAVALDAPGGPLESEPGRAQMPRIEPENLAYLIYTSGSTGRPKGVGVAHAEAAGHLDTLARLLDLGEGERLLQFSSPSFDMAMEEILAPLVSGAAVVLRAAELWQPSVLLDRMAGLGVTVVNLPTAYWHSWSAELGRAVLPEGLALRLVMLGGEAMSGESARRWRRSPLAGLRVLNGYGPTEGVITSTVLEVDGRAAAESAGAVAIGRPLDGRSTLVLDPHGLPVPEGGDGELCLGGPLLARGYLGRPEATAERFVPDPYSGRPGDRLYRTGDRARCRPDGVLEFLGRIDRQVKVRGFRVEPGEVEAALSRHPEVREVAVDPRPDSAGSMRLVAWIVPASLASPPLPAEMRELLGETLPEHMIPSAFVALAEMPLTPNGKIDYRALPEPQAVRSGVGYTAPSTVIEEKLAGLWAEVLGCELVSVHDSFFALGGHSLLGMRLLSRVRDLFGADLPLSALLNEPTVAGLALALEAVQEAPTSSPRLAPVSREGFLPLSPSQQGLWFLDRLEPGRPVYNIASAVALSGPLDSAALEAALGALVRRHEPLRTRFPEVDGEPRQEILPPEPLVLARIDLSSLDDPRSALERLGREQARQAFDLARGPLLRVCLAKLGYAEHVLFVTVHHIVFDGWSEAVFWRDLSALYDQAPLPELPLQYADYAVWQRRRLEGTLAAEVEWWRRRLEGIEPLELPTDRPRPAARTWSGDVLPFALPAPLASAVRELAQAEGATPFMTLLALFSSLLSRTSRQDVFAVGAPVAGRGPSELEGLIGMFVNLLALRADLSGRPTLRNLIGQARETVLAALAHQELPFDRLVQELNPERDLGRNPIFQVAFQVVGAARPLPAFPRVRASAPGFHSATAKFDLELSLEDGGAEIRGECEYSTDLFDASTIERFLARFERLTAAALSEPDLPLAELSLLTEAERRQLLQWSGTSAGLPVAGLVHRLFDEQARRQPEAPAVGDLTYAELRRRATVLALRLRELGVGPEVRVGVCLERSPDLVVSVLAVLEAGGAYVALDPSHPEERLAFQLADSRALFVVARRELAGVRLVSPDEKPETALSLDGPEPLPGNLAYIIYTSGSTGRPKGVELTHGSLRNLVAWHVRAFGLSPADRSALMAGVGFDASVWEIWPTLAAGASLHVMPEAVRMSPEAVRDWLVEQGVTVTYVPRPLAEAALDLDWPHGSALRAVLTGGDRLHRRPSAAVPFVVVNNYGPTEGTVLVTSGAVAPGDSGRAPAIGRPIDGARIFVVDRELLPVPPGVPGELLIGGAGLARGYAGRPDLTASSFVPDALSGGEGGRLYRTGDLVRFLPTGELDFLGRIDHQVKVRGYRIELGEIETALARHPRVREAAVLSLDGSLVAYVVSDADDLEAFLRRSLPDYMVPAAFVPLPALPHNASGKVDRQALARIAPPAAPAGRAFADPVEELVARVWEEVLNRSDVQPGDNFFHLGGHSLLAARVLSRLREALGVELPLQALFESPTVAALAHEVAAARRGIAAVLPPLRPAARGGLLPLSFPQQRLWFMDRLAPDSHTYNIPLAFALRGSLDTAALIGAVRGVVDRHEVLRTRFVEVDGQPWQEILPAGAFAMPVVDLSALPRESRDWELARIGREEGERPFVLSRGPLLRAGLVRLGSAEHALFLTLHHIASDGWSEEILDRELAALYERTPLPALPIQYADYAAWQREWPEEVLASQVEWWTRRLTGLANLEVPTDRARPPVQSFRGALLDLAVPPALAGVLRDLARTRRSTLFMTLLAAWQALFHRITGQDDVAVGSPVANRNEPETEGLIGFFINMLALRTDCGGDPTFGELLERVRSTALEAYDHADVPFERLIDELGLERDLSRQALVQVMFSLHAPVQAPALRGLESHPLHLAGAVAKFDLTLGLFDHGNALDGWIEYSTDLFDRTTVTRLGGWFLRLLESAVEPGRRLSELVLLSAAERHQIFGEWNDTAAPFPAATLMHQFFEAAVDRSPAALAAVWEGCELTYAGLEERANRIAQLLREHGTERGTPVGVWMERSLDMVAGVLAVLKAGGYYVPLDPAWPADRVEAILGTTEAPAVLTRSAHLGRVLEMQWRLPALAAVVCLDVETPEPAPEPVDTESVRAVFDLVSERAVDRVTAGGFVSSFTGLPFSEADVDEYRDRVLSLATPWIGRESRVLEIGSGSGLLMWEIAPRVARFVGLDPSPLTQERNRARAAELAVEVELPVGFAHEIEGWAAGSFDLVLIASTAQFFPGPIYLERVVRLAERLLAPGGAVVIADVPDARHPHKVLSVEEEFFLDLGATVHRRETGFDNELRFRYDVVLTHLRERSKSLLTSWHVERGPAERLPAVAAPEDLAYVIHTSGSTGQPKGIVVQHRPVANLIAWINPAFGLGPSDRVLFVTSLCFDLSVWDIFGVLAAGGCVHVASEEDLQDAERLMRILLEEPVTIWDSAPAALVRLAPLFPSEPAVRSSLRRVMLSGDWIPVTLPDRVRAAFPRAEVTSLGGATEATVWSNWYPIGEVDPEWPSIPYGRPMPNAQYHVLDATLSPCPAGVPGDLYIGGDCLVVGYAHQPDLTAAAFLPDPFGTPGARIYRTGDRARHFPDGNLEFLGRIDHQVKIRGFRIELGEIEVALARHADVREAVVLAREDVPGDKRLVAYVVPAGGQLPDLRDFLRQTLPDYMIPAAFVALEALPVTPNGKLDRRALPAPQWDRTEAVEGAAPSTPTEQALAGLWREILGVENVGVHDSFFDLGGHSLLATQLVARIRESFHVEMPLRLVFQAPALGELAAALDAAVVGGATLSMAEVRRTFRENAIRPIPPMQRTGLLPLSFPQQRLWLVERLTPGESAYHILYVFRLRGPLDAAALASALAALAERHEVLRTRFVERDGQPWQEILPPAPAVLAVEEAAEGEDLERLAREEAARPFDLAAAPPFRARLLRLGAEHHALILTVHHIAFDGWSEPILLDELSALYGAGAQLPELPVQYADFAAWQRAWPEELLAARLSYWAGQLAGPAPLELSTDRPRPPVETFHGAQAAVTVPAGVAAALRGLGRERNATLFMLLLAAWQTLLHRIAGQDDVIVGSPVANRERPEVRGLIGFFVNMLPLRTGLGGDERFEEVLGRVRQTVLEAFDHADVPFERLIDELRLERDLSRHPIFQVLFNLESGEPPRLRLPGVETERLPLAIGIAKLDLSLDLVDAGEKGLAGHIEYNTDLFDAATVERMAGHLGNLLAAVAADASARVSEIGLLTAAERDLLRQWSGAPAFEAPPALLYEAFAARAAEAPGRLALVWGERRLTYGELDERSDRLAARLRSLGVGPEVRVGLCSARTPDLVIGVLGILKAGGAYVPLDPGYPRERLAFTLEDARVPVLVTQEDLLPVLPEHEARILLLDGAEMNVAAERPPALAAPDNLAYLIYTSGSTGRPKGVAITHRSAVEMVRWASGVFPAGDLAGVLASTSICFDLSVFEIFLPLSRGGAVVLAANALELPLLPAAGEVTLINTVPSAMAELVRTGGVPASVRTVNLAGEALPGTLVDEIYDRTAGVRVMNLYGPSEDTTYSTFAEVCRGTAVPSIGRPIDGSRAWVLDRAGLPAPPGVPGDLHLGGAGLARGYLERPDLTAERFVPDAWSGEPGGRLYRTGDLVRWLPDGTLAFLGRADHQVKVRGFRIEPGEVEAALARHPAVREAVVAVQGDTLADRRLVAWVTPREERPAPSDLRDFLLSRLPGPAVPSAFVVLDELPRTPNGKVDRRALPSLEAEAERSTPYAAPSTPTGEVLAGIWSSLLGVERVGDHDSFFELGGHSLLASQLVFRVREAFGAELPLSAVFQAPTLDALAGAVAAASSSASSGPVLRPIPRTGDLTGLPLSASQLRQWFLVQLEPESVDFNLPITVRLEGDLDTAALAAALRALVRRHEALRTTFVAVGGRPAAVIAVELDLPLPVLDLSSTPQSEREAATLRAAEAESDRPFSLTHGPLVRALLIRLEDREHLLVLTFHHIVFDGFSTGVLLHDLSALYEAEAAGRPATLPALPVQYVDYAAWQQEWLASPALRAKLARWKERLAGASQVLDLPTDRPRPAMPGPLSEMVPVTLPAAGTAEIRKLAAREGVTLFMALLAGYAALLSRYTGQDDLNVGTFVANRSHPALERLIGFFVNTLVLRVDLAGDPSFRELLARVREMALDAFENQDVPFESLLDELETGRDLSRGPLFQVMFGLQNFAMPTIEVPGLSFRPVSLSEHARTNGELAFWMWEKDGALGGLLQLSSDLFDSPTGLRMFRHMERLLAAGAADPGLRLSELPLLTAAETAEILVEWNRPGEREPEPDALVHERFEHWARVRPGAVALETADGGEVLTYAELNRRGNRLAHRLRRLGVGSDSIVGIWAERCVELVVGVLGVLKAGGAYMPLDPAMPADRLAAIVRGAGMSVLLARDGRPAGLPPFDGEVVALRGLSASPEDDANPAPLAAPESLVYVLFTSGSTGVPKGVLIPHSALANFAETTRRLYGIGPEDRVLQFSSLVFDISVEEIFTSWTAGATLVLRDEEMVSSPARFLRACGELNVQMIDLPTAYWHELGVELAKGEVPLPLCVRSVIFAGERALLDRMAGWQEAMRRGVRLFNSYGPSEATPANSVFDPAEPAAGMSTNGLSIGKPMRGARLYVTGPDLRPVPAGVAGELLIAGAGLGRGYAGRPDLTAEKFVPDPFSSIPGERAYHTGDRVRWLTDGNLEFLGRVDDQVKIRGFRIEPGEIAAVLCRHPGVREAVVVPREAGGVAGVGLRLVAYAAADPGVTAAELRDLIKAALPAYMVPADFVLLDALPLTATGKLDRRALPEPSAGGDEEGYAPPETATEELLAGLWAGLLGRERVGIYDNFFDLGGHSLLAPQMFSQVEETFQVELPLRMLFEGPTVAQLANLIELELLAQIEELSDDEAESLVLSD